MIKIFTTETVKTLDKYTITHEPISSVNLVERAANVFAGEFSRRYGKQKRVIVFAGQGNNGADALAISRLLAEDYSFTRIEAYLFNTHTGQLSAECEINKRRLSATGGVAFAEVSARFTPPPLDKHDIVIDGLFGSGLKRPLEGGFAKLAKYINASGAKVVSIDIPSGLFGEDNSVNTPETIVRASLTLSFGFPKLAFLLPENAPYAGSWKVLDIGIHPDIIASTPTPYYLVTEEDAGKRIRPRGKFAHKGMFGHALLIAGSRGKAGAALLAARACLRSGVGLLTVHLPSCAEGFIQTAFPEAMVSPDTHPGHFASLPELTGYSAIGIGPGLGRHPESAAALKALLEQASCPLVVDADALNLLAADKELLNLLPACSILTPHPKEFDRLAGESASSYERLKKAQAFAGEHRLILVLKGAYTATCTPEGNVYFNSSGNPGMATAGSGDVLTGIILAFLAAGYKPEDAAITGVLLHGIAADLAVIYQSEESLLAGDIIEMLGKAFKQVTANEN
ncbi:MAG: NAD(P)H-hydrate dehydratase [Tannerellaceae bacterium]|jgi:NAD(P)H-hydrate epimerase|nr:NAD(P)H-hydrate dehydratase [Tannerellaceae bacterium]